MRVYIKKEAFSVIGDLVDNGTLNDNEARWLIESGESFHGEKDKASFTFMDHRLPEFVLPMHLLKEDK